MPANQPLTMPAKEVWFYKTGEDYDIFSNVTDVGFKINIAGYDCYPTSSEAVFQAVKCISNWDRSQEEFNVALKLIRANGTGFQGPYGEMLTLPDKYGNPINLTANNQAGAWIQRMAGQLPGFNHTDVHITYTGQNYSPENYGFIIGGQFNQFINISVKEQLMYEILLCKFTQNPALLKELLATGNKKIVENTSLAGYDDHFWGNGFDGKGRNALGFALMRIREDLSKELQQNKKIEVRTGLSNYFTQQLYLTRSSIPEEKQYIDESLLQQVEPCKTIAEFKMASAKDKTLGFNAAEVKPTKAALTKALEGTRPDNYFIHSNVVLNSPMARVIRAMADQTKCTGFKVSPNTSEQRKQDSPYVFKFRFANQQDAKNFCVNQLNNPKKNIIPTADSSFVVILEEQQAQKIFTAIGIPDHGRTKKHSMLNAIKYDLGIETNSQITLPKPPKPVKSSPTSTDQKTTTQQVTTTHDSIIPVNKTGNGGDGKIHPFTYLWQDVGGKTIDSVTQATQIINDINKMLQANQNAKIAITYAANNGQSTAIIGSYISGKPYTIDGANQAETFKHVAEWIHNNELQDRVHVLPVTTVGCNQDTVKRDMQNIAKHLGAEWVVLGLKGHKEKNPMQPEATGYAVGGGVSANWATSSEGQSVAAAMEAMTTKVVSSGLTQDSLSLRTAYLAGKQSPKTLLRQDQLANKATNPSQPYTKSPDPQDKKTSVTGKLDSLGKAFKAADPVISPEKVNLIAKCDWIKINQHDELMFKSDQPEPEKKVITSSEYLGSIVAKKSEDLLVNIRTNSLECPLDKSGQQKPNQVIAIVFALEQLVETNTKEGNKDLLCVEANSAFSVNHLTSILEELQKQQIAVQFKPCNECSQEILDLINKHNKNLHEFAEIPQPIPIYKPRPPKSNRSPG